MKHFLKTFFLIYSPLWLRIYLLRRKGRVGNNFKLAGGSWIYANKIDIGDDVIIEKNVTISTASLSLGNKVHIQKDVNMVADKSISIGELSLIMQNNTFGGSQTCNSSLNIGRRVHIYQDCYINTTGEIIFEDGVGIGGRSLIFTHGSWQNAYEGFPFGFGNVTIKKNAWLPWQVFVMPGVTIGEEATIGSAALVGKDVPPRSFAVGVPAKVIKSGDEYIKKMGPSAKTDLMRQTFLRFSNNYSFYNGRKSEIVEEPDKLVLKFDSFRIVFSLTPFTPTHNEIILTETEDALQPGMYDLNRKTGKSNGNPIGQAYISSLSIFGIRFDVE